MSVALQVQLRGNVTAAIEQRLEKLQPDRLNQLLSEPLRVFWRNRLKGLGKNKRGWPSTGFWESAARSVQAVTVPGGLLLSVNKVGVRQRAYGGVIKPQRARALTIPISPVSYGHRASEFPGLFLLKTKKGAYLVQHGQQISSTGKTEPRQKAGGHSRRRLRSGLVFLFKLSQGVTQTGDDRVIPTADEITEVAMGTIMKEVKV